MENLSFEKQLEVAAQIFNAYMLHKAYINKHSSTLSQAEWLKIMDRNKNIMKMHLDYMKNISIEGDN